MAYKRSRKDFESDLQRRESPYVVYGTPLPPLDEHTRDDGSFVPVWKQEVTDDRGRKRLHGAFTGGFSAGYFNTVGSKEGWAPSTFVSSRTNRAKNAQNAANQKPEDFMDEEDIREQEESRQLSTDQNFAGFGTADDANHKDSLMDLFRPAEQTMGAKLLNKMGWKSGQGIGPKIRRRADPEDETSAIYLFAPDDAPMISLIKKVDDKGLGFGGQTKSGTLPNPRVLPNKTQSASESDEETKRPGLNFASRSKKPTKAKRGAFGVGILNDTGSDDEDPYSIGPKVSYNKIIGGDKRPKKKSSNTNANPLLKNKPIFVSKRLTSISSALRKCHDGRLPLDGFVLADELDTFSTLSINEEKYRPPKVPEGWKSSKVVVSDPSAELSTNQSTAEAARASTLTSATRGALLGETALPGKSVFDFLTPAAREKLMKASGKVNLPPALGESLPGTSSHQTRDTEVPVPPIDPRTALQALSRILNGGFTPYTQDAAKSSRYKSYLESQANITAPDAETANDLLLTSTPPPAVKLTHPPTMSQDEFLLELHEFARTAEVFKPVSGPMASRFTTSTSTTASSTISPTPDSAGQDLLTHPTNSNKPRDPAEEAAKMGMFGHLTRSVTNFYPARLLCKRFGVAMPTHADDDSSQSTPAQSFTPGSADIYSGADGGGGTMLGMSRFQSGGVQHDEKEGVEATGRTPRHASDDTTKAAGESGQGTSGVVIDPERNEALESERPGAAVFKAIFGSDEEDDGDDD